MIDYERLESAIEPSSESRNSFLEGRKKKKNLWIIEAAGKFMWAVF